MAEEIVEQQEVIEPDQSGQESTDTTAVDTGEGKESEQEEVAAKTFTQEELEAEIGKRLARERRKFERQQQNREPAKKVEVLAADQYESIEKYAEAIAEKKLQDAKVKESQEQEVKTFQSQVDKAIDKYPDFEKVAFTHPFMTEEMASAIRTSESATEVAYYLGSNLDEAERISNLTPVQQIRAIGKLEAKFENKETRQSSSAPAPIKPVGSKGATAPTDPSKMTMEQYREHRKKQGASWAR